MSALRDVIRQSELSGAKRRAAVLYIDRLPQGFAKPHYLRLARQALNSLISADRAQVFDLACGRTAVVWRDNGGLELENARRSLDHLLSDQPEMSLPSGCALLSGYDLPQQAACLLDDLTDIPRPEHAIRRSAIDVKLLASLETTLARADLSCFTRTRSVMDLGGVSSLNPTVTPVWQERSFAIDDLADNLSPGRDLQADPWLFGRLTRTLDMRMLALLAAPGELTRCGLFAINLNVATILSPAFLRFDSALPTHLRGEVILILRAADVIANCRDFAFARNFARARLYRLALANVTASLLELLDVAAAGIDLLHVPLTPALRAADTSWRRLVPPGSGLVLTNVNRPSDLSWAVEHGFRLGRGTLFSV